MPNSGWRSTPPQTIRFDSRRGRAAVQDLIVSVAELLGRPGAYRDVRLAAPLEGVAIALARLDPARVSADLRAESVVEGVLVTGMVRGETVLTCARCLRESSDPVEVDVCELYAAAGHKPEDDEEVYEVRGAELDLEPMLRDAIALALPLNPHCADGCEGLCAMCGRNLVDGRCECWESDHDPRWAALDKLKESLS
jgi:uncharacterized protein